MLLNLKAIKLHFLKNAPQCDTLVLIVNSKNDRQVFTVAGHDAKLSREIIQLAFQRNVEHFKAANYALGMEGMIE